MEISPKVYKIFNENNIKKLKEILKIPNDNYTCSECDLIPKILNIDYGLGKIEFNCEIHGTKIMILEEYIYLKYINIFIIIKNVVFVI